MPEFEALKVSGEGQRRRWKALERDWPELFTIPKLRRLWPGNPPSSFLGGAERHSTGALSAQRGALQATACRAGFSLFFPQTKPDWLHLGAETAKKMATADAGTGF